MEVSKEVITLEDNVALHQNCILIGNDVTSEEGEIVFVNKEYNIRIKPDGRVVHNGQEVPVDKTLVQNLEHILRKLLTQLIENGNKAT